MSDQFTCCHDFFGDVALPACLSVENVSTAGRGSSGLSAEGKPALSRRERFRTYVSPRRTDGAEQVCLPPLMTAVLHAERLDL